MANPGLITIYDSSDSDTDSLDSWDSGRGRARRLPARLQRQASLSISPRDSSEDRFDMPSSPIQHTDVADDAATLDSHRHDSQDFQIHEDGGHEIETTGSSLSSPTHAIGSPYGQFCSPPNSGHSPSESMAISLPAGPGTDSEALNDPASSLHTEYDSWLRKRADVPGFLYFASEQLWPVVRDADGSLRMLTERDGVEKLLQPDRAVDEPLTHDPATADNHVYCRDAGGIENAENQPRMSLTGTTAAATAELNTLVGGEPSSGDTKQSPTSLSAVTRARSADCAGCQRQSKPCWFHTPTGIKGTDLSRKAKAQTHTNAAHIVGNAGAEEQVRGLEAAGSPPMLHGGSRLAGSDATDASQADGVQQEPSPRSDTPAKSMRNTSRSCSVTGSDGDQASTTPPDAVNLPLVGPESPALRRTTRRHAPRKALTRQIEPRSTTARKGGVPGRGRNDRAVTPRRRAAKLQAGLSDIAMWDLDNAVLHIPALGGRFTLEFDLPDHRCPPTSGITIQPGPQDCIVEDAVFPAKTVLEKWGSYYLVEWENDEITWVTKSNVSEDLVTNFETNYKGFGPGVQNIVASRWKGRREQLRLAWRQRKLHEACWVDKKKVSKECLRRLGWQ